MSEMKDKMQIKVCSGEASTKNEQSKNAEGKNAQNKNGEKSSNCTCSEDKEKPYKTEADFFPYIGNRTCNRGAFFRTSLSI